MHAHCLTGPHLPPLGSPALVSHRQRSMRVIILNYTHSLETQPGMCDFVSETKGEKDRKTET